jgi:ABC-type transport system involved in cytochrome c biogenesis permease component
VSSISAMLYRETKIRATNITFVFWDLFYPLCYLLVFGVGVTASLGTPQSAPGVTYNSFFLAGVLGMASFGIASNSSWSFFMDRDNGIFYEMLTYPMSRSEYLLGKVLFNVFIAIVQMVITLGLGTWLLGIRLRVDLLPLLVVTVIFGTAGWFFFYTIFALKIRRNDIFNSVTSVFYFVFLFCQLDVLSARTAAALVSRDWTRKSDHMAGGSASLHIDWARHPTPARNGSGGVRDFCSGVFRICGAQPDADLVGNAAASLGS